MDRPFAAYKGSEPYVFVSYAHEDNDSVYAEIQWLKDQGFNIWYDEGISPGSEWHQELADRIDDCSLFLYFVTPRSARSEHCQREVHYAIDHGMQLLAVHLEETELPGGVDLSLSSIQAIIRHELSDLDYRIKLLKGTGDHIQRGMAQVSESSVTILGVSPKVCAMVGLTGLLIGGIITAMALWNSAPDPSVGSRQLIRSTIDRPSNIHDPELLRQPLALTKDGSSIVFAGQTEDGFQLFLRKLEELDPAPITSIKVGSVVLPGPGNFSLSPDGQWVAYLDGGDSATIKKVRLSGGQPITLCEIEDGEFTGMDWGQTGIIVFSNTAYGGLMQVADSGGDPEPLTHVDDRVLHASPHFLPDGQALMYAHANFGDGPTTARIYVLSLKSGEARFLLEGRSPQIATSGHLLFYREGDSTIWATAFDLNRFEVTGKPVPIVQGVKYYYLAHYSLSAIGSMVYWTGGEEIWEKRSSLVWVDREGAEEPLALPPDHYYQPRVSPDSQSIAMAISPARGESEVWVYSTIRGTFDRLTSDGPFYSPVWSMDSLRLAFGRSQDQQGIYTRAADGSGAIEKLTAAEETNESYPRSWTADGKHLLFDSCPTVPGPNRGCNPGVLSSGKDPSARLLQETPFSETYVTASPDGRWIAYQSNESGEAQIYVRPFPDFESRRWPVSVGGGRMPQWGPDGKEIFYLGPTHMMAVPVATGSTFDAGVPRALFALRQIVRDGFLRDRLINYSVAPDGQRFLMLKPAGTDVERQTIVLLQHVFDELERLAPTK